MGSARERRLSTLAVAVEFAVAVASLSAFANDCGVGQGVRNESDEGRAGEREMKGRLK
jgi:hypothetical protein